MAASKENGATVRAQISKSAICQEGARRNYKRAAKYDRNTKIKIMTKHDNFIQERRKIIKFRECFLGLNSEYSVFLHLPPIKSIQT